MFEWYLNGIGFFLFCVPFNGIEWYFILPLTEWYSVVCSGILLTLFVRTCPGRNHVRLLNMNTTVQLQSDRHFSVQWTCSDIDHDIELWCLHIVSLQYQATRPFYIQVEMPEQAVKGEQIGVRIALFNYWDRFLEVSQSMH